jgi:tetratricopeptide (TPR) repeat protein
MSAKINYYREGFCLLALALALAGCTPAGPRALLNGKKYLDAGDTTAAVEALKTATTLLATNAQAWNYYGVALQRAGQPDEAASAYHRALDLDRDLLEARFNAGMLALEQDQPESAKAEFTAYTLRRPNDPTGWLRLGAAQLKLGEIVPAERSFSTVLALKNSEAEAYNGLGLARIQRAKYRDAAQFFAAAVQLKPDYAAALLNLATVNAEYLRDNKVALEKYRAYLALVPKPANYDAVSDLADNLEKTLAPPPAAVAPVPVATAPKPNPPVTVAEAKPPVKVVTTPRPVSTPRPPPVVSQPVVAVTPLPAQVVQLPPETKIVTAPNPTPAPPAAPPVVELPVPEPPAKPSLWSRVFGAPETNPPSSTYVKTGLTPLPDAGKPAAPVAAPVVVAAPPVTIPPVTVPPPAVVPEKKATPVVIVPPAPVDFPRYNYLSPRPPLPGDRRAAAAAFASARTAEQGEQWLVALEAYRQAVAADPGWFEAQYNTGVMAQRVKNYPLALASYETALALMPGSVSARYNFALALRAAGYAPDAAAELKKILAANPTEARAHLVLANLCAQQLHDPMQARQHYLKVLELDPTNAHAADIRFWLAANPGE